MRRFARVSAATRVTHRHRAVARHRWRLLSRYLPLPHTAGSILRISRRYAHNTAAHACVCMLLRRRARRMRRVAPRLWGGIEQTRTARCIAYKTRRQHARRNQAWRASSAAACRGKQRTAASAHIARIAAKRGSGPVISHLAAAILIYARHRVNGKRDITSRWATSSRARAKQNAFLHHTHHTRMA